MACPGPRRGPAGPLCGSPRARHRRRRRSSRPSPPRGRRAPGAARAPRRHASSGRSARAGDVRPSPTPLRARTSRGLTRGRLHDAEQPEDDDHEHRNTQQVEAYSAHRNTSSLERGSERGPALHRQSLCPPPLRDVFPDAARLALARCSASREGRHSVAAATARRVARLFRQGPADGRTAARHSHQHVAVSKPSSLCSIAPPVKSRTERNRRSESCGAQGRAAAAAATRIRRYPGFEASGRSFFWPASS